jgi:lipopolysaccharide transport system ATP-binding protein
MSSIPVISVDNLSKAYRIGAKEKMPDTLIAAARNWIRQPFKRFRSVRELIDSIHTTAHMDTPNTVWALRGVSFTVNNGDVTAVIGPNGAGKSTLLKILSRITEPTSGRAVVRGRVSSLLEVGTGFHPELTGRENIYMNGTILGMRKRELDRKFGDIVDFSGIDTYLDTPIKRYSTGMQVRLAFAIAAHLEPDILIVDEVLAVGDTAFQRKCIGKMQEAAQRGRTVLFVTHNMTAAQSLCKAGLVLTNGALVYEGPITTAIAHYLQHVSTSTTATTDLRNHPHRLPRSLPILTRLTIRVSNTPSTTLRMGGPLELEVDYTLPSNFRGLRLGITIEDLFGVPLVSFSPTFQDPDLLTRAPPTGLARCSIPQLNLVPGHYYITLYVESSLGQCDTITRVCQLTVVADDVFRTGRTLTRQHGIFFASSYWTVNPAAT